MKTCSLDYETRSTCDLKVAGAYVYARHPGTRVLCAAYSIDGGPVKVWRIWERKAMPADLKRAMLDPKVEMHAWNSQFERLITKYVLGIDVPIERWHCTAAWARASGLPGKLETVLEMIGEGKQLAYKRAGYRVMMKWCQPLKGSVDEWADDPGEYESLVEYCKEDVRSEMRLQAYLSDSPMSDEELADFRLCERINDRGLPIDVELAVAAQAYGEQEKKELAEELRKLSGGAITSASQHARVKDWLKANLEGGAFERYFRKVYLDSGNKPVVKESTDKAARADFLNWTQAEELHPEAVALIRNIDDAGKSSVAKFKVMAARASQTGRAEGSYLAFGAVQTKRYSSRGVQAHNFPRDVPKDVDGAVQAVLAKAPLEHAMHVLSSLLRPAIKAPPGRVLVWGDWSSVEARGMPWLAGAQAKLNLYRDNLDVYRVNAEHIFGTPYEKVGDSERQIGKVAELSLQFGGAVGALKAMARGYGISLDDELALQIVVRWRKANAWAMDFSTQLMSAYRGAINGRSQDVNGIVYSNTTNDKVGCIVVCELPGGTKLYYPGNGVVDVIRPPNKSPEARWTWRWMPGSRKSMLPGGGWVLPKGAPEEVREEVRRILSQRGPGHKDVKLGEWLTVKVKQDPTKGQKDATAIDFEKAGAAHFTTERVWHGLLAENVTQAICADLLRDTLWRVNKWLGNEKVDAYIIGHTHDEIILESSERHEDLARNILRREMLRVPEWLPGFPLGCEVKSGLRYTK